MVVVQIEVTTPMSDFIIFSTSASLPFRKPYLFLFMMDEKNRDSHLSVLLFSIVKLRRPNSKDRNNPHVWRINRTTNVVIKDEKSPSESASISEPVSTGSKE